LDDRSITRFGVATVKEILQIIVTVVEGGAALAVEKVKHIVDLSVHSLAFVTENALDFCLFALLALLDVRAESCEAAVALDIGAAKIVVNLLVDHTRPADDALLALGAVNFIDEALPFLAVGGQILALNVVRKSYPTVNTITTAAKGFNFRAENYGFPLDYPMFADYRPANG
jgi:hypothetical protein